jgi:hypothetical protein
MMLASDLLVAIDLAVVGSDGQPTSRIEVGDTFTLRGSTRDLQQQGEGVFAAYTDVTYDVALVEAVGSPLVSDGFPHAISGDATTAGVLNEVGGFRDFQHGFVDTGNDVLFEMAFVAQGPGEVIFAANPADDVVAHDVLLVGLDVPVLPHEVEYGYARLQIGNPTEHPPSPWRNPVNPFDVNNDGEETDADAAQIEDELDAVGPSELPAVDSAAGPPPYFDITGDGFLGQDDLESMRERLFAPERPTPPAQTPPSSDPADSFFELARQTLTSLAEIGTPVRLEVVNTRTGEVAGDVKTGDILRVRAFIMNLDDASDRAAAFTTLAAANVTKLVFDPNQFWEFPGSRYDFDPRAHLHQFGEGALLETHLVANAEGTATISTRFEYNPGPQGMSMPDDVVDLLAATIVHQAVDIEISGQGQPTARADTYSFGNEVPLVVSAENGLLANDQASPSGQPLRAQLVSLPNPRTDKGNVTVAEDGSFVYQPRSGYRGRDEFQYVAISDEGTSNVATVTVTGELPPVAKVLVRPIDENGQLLTTVNVGQEFFLLGIVEDFRGSPNGDPRGVYRVNMQVQFTSSLLEVNGDVELDSVYNAFSWGETSVSSDSIQVHGHSGLTATGPGEQEVFRVPMLATEAGQADLTISSLDNVQLMRFGVPRVQDHIQVVDATLTVAHNQWQNPENPLDTNADGDVAPLDALLGLNSLNHRGAITLRADNINWEGKRVYLDNNGDKNHTPGDVLVVVNHLNLGAENAAETTPVVAHTKIASTPALTPKPSQNRDTSLSAENSRQSAVDGQTASPLPPADSFVDRLHVDPPKSGGEQLNSEELLTLLAADIFRAWFPSGIVTE